MEKQLRRAGTFQSSTLVDFINYAGWPLLAIYGFSMFVYPWLAGNWNWGHVQEVWERWQTFNAAALAFVASLVAFNISRFNESRQRERDFVAAKAFLPSTLSGLMEYCAQSARILGVMWEHDDASDKAFEHLDLPEDYRDVFSNCIRHADPAVGSYLSNILVRLQVQEARLRDAVRETIKGNDRVVDKHNLIAYLLRLGEIYALLGNLFAFARGEEVFHEKQLGWDDMRSAYSLLGIEVDDFFIDERMNLELFTKRWLERTYKNSNEAAQ